MTFIFKNIFSKKDINTYFFLWIYASLLHFLENPVGVIHLVIILGLPLLFWHRNELLKFIFLLIYSAFIVGELPKTANHSVVVLFVNCSLIFSIFKNYLKDKKIKLEFDLPQRQTAMIFLSLLYFFAFFHKLNTAYLDLNLSCATQIYQKLLSTPLGILLPNSAFVYWFNIYGSLILEGLLSLLFLFYPPLGVFLGFIFHSFLSFGMLYDFSAVVFALYYIIGDNTSKVASSKSHRWGMNILRFSLVPLLTVNVLKFKLPLDHHILTTIFFIIGSSLLILPGLKLRQSFRLKKLKLSHFQWGLIFVFILNGFSPYLGFKTTSNFSMFSNLRVEGKGSNHLLIKDELEVTSFNDDIAWIISAKGPPEEWILHKGIGIPFMELRRVVTELRLMGYPYLKISYLRGDKLFQFDNALGERSELSDLPFWQRKLLGWRGVRRDGVEVCRW